MTRSNFLYNKIKDIYMLERKEVLIREINAILKDKAKLMPSGTIIKMDYDYVDYKLSENNAKSEDIELFREYSFASIHGDKEFQFPLTYDFGKNAFDNPISIGRLDEIIEDVITSPTIRQYVTDSAERVVKFIEDLVHDVLKTEGLNELIEEYINVINDRDADFPDMNTDAFKNYFKKYNHLSHDDLIVYALRDGLKRYYDTLKGGVNSKGNPVIVREQLSFANVIKFDFENETVHMEKHRNQTVIRDNGTYTFDDCREMNEIHGWKVKDALSNVDDVKQFLSTLEE